MTPLTSLPDLTGRPVVGTGRSRIGVVRHVYAPVEQGRAGGCITVLTPTGCSAVPLARAAYEDPVVVVPYSGEALADAPPVEDGCAELSCGELDRLYAHYAVPSPATGQVVLRRVDPVRVRPA